MLVETDEALVLIATWYQVDYDRLSLELVYNIAKNDGGIAT